MLGPPWVREQSDAVLSCQFEQAYERQNFVQPLYQLTSGQWYPQAILDSGVPAEQSAYPNAQLTSCQQIISPTGPVVVEVACRGTNWHYRFDWTPFSGSMSFDGNGRVDGWSEPRDWKLSE